MDRFQFGGVTFQPETRELLSAAERVELKPKNAEVLHYLILHRDRVVGREELFDQLWQGAVVSDHSLTKVITELRQTLGDSARNSTYIRTLHKKGYKWVFEPTAHLQKEQAPYHEPVAQKQVSPVGVQDHAPETPGESLSSVEAPVQKAPIQKALVQKALAQTVQEQATVQTQTSAAVASQTSPRAPGFRIAAVAVLAAALVLGAFFTRERNTQAPVTQAVSHAPIALLPFGNQTGDQDQQWVEVGLRDMVARVLADIPSADLAPVDDLKKAVGDWTGFIEGTPTHKDLEKLRLMVDYSWLVSTRVRFEPNDAYELEFNMHSPDGQVLHHKVTAPTLTGVTELMAYAVASKAGLKVGNPESAFSADNFINETYAKGAWFFEEDQIRKAVNHFQVCLDNDPSLTWARFQMGRCLRYLGEWERSQELFTRVVEEARLKRNPRMEADASRYLGLLSTERGSWDQAIQWTERALVLYRNLDHLHGMIVIRNQNAIIHARKGDLDKAVNLLNESLTQLPKLGNRFVESQTLIKLGTLRSMQGRMRDAEEEFNRALAIVKALGDLANEGALLNNLGNIANMRRDYQGAEPHYRNALAIWRQLGNKNSEASTLQNLGLIARALGDNEQADLLVKDALKISRELGNHYLENICVNQLGVNAIMIGDLEQAAQYLQQGAALARDRKNGVLESDAVCYLALLTLRQGEAVKAGTLLNQVAELGDGEPLFHTTASLIAYEQGSWRDAYDLQLKARDLSGERWSKTDEMVLVTYEKALRDNARLPLPDPQYLPMY